MTQRRLLRLSGPDTRSFLQNLVTNNVDGLEAGLVYAALLTPQGKYMADFFMAPDGDDVLIDVAEELGDTLQTRLGMYKLRSAVEISAAELHVHRGLGAAPADGFADPRSPAMGWRAYRAEPAEEDGVDWDALRVEHLIPESLVELTPDTFILEAGFERIHGVDFRKGCYVGQEVTARMKHKTTLNKGLVRVEVEGEAPVGDDILSGSKPAGTIFTQSGGHAIAYLRFNRAKGDLSAGDAKVTWAGPENST